MECEHCYAHTPGARDERELSGGEARAVFDDLAAFGCPVVLFSGGEPLLREDVPDLVRYAVSAGLRVVVSTNGTLISDDMAERLKESGTAYVGVSLDGLREIHDRFRGRIGAFDLALEGIRACRRTGLKVGLRMTLTRHNIGDLSGVFELIRQEDIPRACFYHLVYAGRGVGLRDADLSHAQTREAVDRIVDFAAESRRRGERREVLTVDNHCDGPYLYLRMRKERHPEADRVLGLLRANGGSPSGMGIACVSWDGAVYPDQFWRGHPLGNVRERPFSAIWSDDSIEWLARLRHRESYIDSRCRRCRFWEMCRGNCRARAEAALGDPWACDPACYLTDAEIATGPEEGT